MSTTKIFLVTTLVIIAILALAVWSKETSIEFPTPTFDELEVGPEYAETPESASYEIDGERITLIDGRFEREAARGSASTETISIFDEPIYGDLDGDGDDDAMMFLVRDTGGSGTFYYVAVAAKAWKGYLGTKAILLGDRIAPDTIRMRNGVITVNYGDRKEGEPMSAPTSVGVTKYITVGDGDIVEVDVSGEGTQLLEGYLNMNHEVRTFTPCNADETYWIVGDSPSYTELKETYEERLEGAQPYMPLFVVLTGNVVDTPEDGFGVSYEYGFSAKELVRAPARGGCRSEIILVESPYRDEAITSPFTVSGEARGTWYFEGDFPLLLLDGNGDEIATSYASAEGEWMTEDFVPFTGEITFEDPGTKRGVLIFERDNPSGLPEHADRIGIPVMFE